MKNWSRTAFAGYLAAMIDGEGHIEIVGTYSVRIRIANTVKRTLQAIVTRLGYGRVIEYRRPPGSTYKRLFSIEVSNARDVGRLFDLCGDFIHMKRRRMNSAMSVVRRVLMAGSLLDRRNRRILFYIRRGYQQRRIARMFRVSEQLISRVKSGHTWKSVITAHRIRSLRKVFPRGADQLMRLHPA